MPLYFIQDTHSAVLDFVTRFDFDGDWNGANNWKNAYVYDLPGSVYYAVIESTGHYFITYAFYHARDYTARPFEGYAPKTEHENDMEGCTLVIEKDQTSWGKPILLETLAHDHFYKYDNPHYRKVHEGALPLDGSIVFLKEEDKTHHRQPAIYIEPEGHGVRAATSQVLESGFQHPGVIYRFAGRGAEVPRSSNDQDVSYDLISIEETLWAKRNEVGKTSTYCCTDLYNLPDGQNAQIGSSFNGPIGSCSAKPPWGWDQADDGPIKKGDWFRNPLYAYNQQLQIDGFSGKYVYNPYLQVDPGNGSKNGTLCSESSESKNVKEAAASTLFGIGKVLFSGGLSSKSIGDRAKQLFMTDTVLLEWAKKEDFERWEWNKALVASNLPSVVTESLTDQMRIPLLENFLFSSPHFKAPARYFDSLVVRYKYPLDGARAKVYWTYDDMTDFDETYSQSLNLTKAEKWKMARIDLAQSKQWDKTKTVSQIRVEILSSQGEKLATVDPTKPSAASNDTSIPFVINYIIFDRDSFADTFER